MASPHLSRNDVRAHTMYIVTPVTRLYTLLHVQVPLCYPPYFRHMSRAHQVSDLDLGVSNFKYRFQPTRSCGHASSQPLLTASALVTMSSLSYVIIPPFLAYYRCHNLKLESSQHLRSVVPPMSVRSSSSFHNKSADIIMAEVESFCFRSFDFRPHGLTPDLDHIDPFNSVIRPTSHQSKIHHCTSCQ